MSAETLKTDFGEHDCVTVPEAGLAGVKNGALLRIASERYDVFVTVDANLKYQQNLQKIAVGILVLRAASNDMADLRPLVPAALDALRAFTPGSVVEIGARLP